MERTLARLDTDYIDLLLIHQPAGNSIAGYKLMEKAYKAGKVRAIGLSNFTPAQIREILDVCEVKPAVLQTEVHPYSQEKALKQFLNGEGIVVQAWYPLGHGDKALLEEPLFAQLGEKYGKSPAQIILRWHIQDGNVVIPGSKNPAHIQRQLRPVRLCPDGRGDGAASPRWMRRSATTPPRRRPSPGTRPWFPPWTNKNKKGRVPMRKNFGSKSWFYPLPVLILGTYNPDGTPDAMNAAWGGLYDADKVVLCLSAGHRTTKNIQARGAFTVSFADAAHVVPADYVGVVSGNAEPDKVKKAGFHPVRSEFVDAPLFEELPVAMECTLLKVNEDGNIIGQIQNVSVDESVLDAGGNLSMDAFRPIAFEPAGSGYHVLGGKVGSAFQDGLRLK